MKRVPSDLPRDPTPAGAYLFAEYFPENGEKITISSREYPDLVGLVGVLILGGWDVYRVVPDAPRET